MRTVPGGAPSVLCVRSPCGPRLPRGLGGAASRPPGCRAHIAHRRCRGDRVKMPITSLRPVSNSRGHRYSSPSMHACSHGVVPSIREASPTLHHRLIRLAGLGHAQQAHLAPESPPESTTPKRQKRGMRPDRDRQLTHGGWPVSIADQFTGKPDTYRCSSYAEIQRPGVAPPCFLFIHGRWFVCPPSELRGEA